MNHQKHKTWFKFLSIISSLVFYTWLICLGVLIHQTFDLNTSLSALILVVDVLMTFFSNYFDILLYVQSDKDIDTILQYVVTWQKACKFKIILAFSIVVAYVILLMTQPDHFRDHDLQYLFEILLLTTCGFAQTTIFGKLQFVQEDCTVRCDHGRNVNVINSPGALNENQLNICQRFSRSDVRFSSDIQVNVCDNLGK